MSLQRHVLVPFMIGALMLAGCGGGGDQPAADTAAAGNAAAVGSDLTPFEVLNGIGPVTEPLSLGPVDPSLAEQGEDLFAGKCSACHKMDERYVGPPLGGITTRRTPAYVMNMLLNPEEMYTRHPDARALLAQYMTQMPNLQLSREEARAILEYLRTQHDSAAGEE